jgi:hypothetical protein
MQKIKGSLSYHEVKQFITLPDEKLIIAKREHWIAIVQPVILTVLLNFFFTGIGFLLTVLRPGWFSFVAILVLTMSALSFTMLLKLITDWYYRIFVITTRKILDVSYTPFSQKIDDVFLDQVRITEIDVKMRNFLYQLIDVGDVIIFFDRPSHEKTFVLHNLKNPRQNGVFLADALENIMHKSPIWFNPREDTNKQQTSPYQYADDIEKESVEKVVTKRNISKL